MVGYNITLGGWNYVQGDYIIHSPVDDERQVHPYAWLPVLLEHVPVAGES